MTEQEKQSRKQRNIKRYWKFISEVLKTAPPATQNFAAQKRVINGVFYDVHHIIPKELRKESSNASWNLILLTKKQHLLAHNILNRIFDRPNEIINHLDRVAYVNDVYLMNNHPKVNVAKWLTTVKNQELAYVLKKFANGQVDRKTCIKLINEFVKLGKLSEYHKAPEETKK